MQGKITPDLSICLAEDGFSLDELVVVLSDVFERKALPELIRLILMLAQEVLVCRIERGVSTMACGCGCRVLRPHDGYSRRIRTSVGEVRMTFWRRRCRDCGKVVVPIRRFLRLGRYQTKTNELEKLVVEAAGATSYRRAVKGLAEHGKAVLPHQTAHRWVMDTDCDEIRLSGKVSGSIPLQIFADGTKFKGGGVGGEARKGDIKVAIGVNTLGEVFPLGTWAGASWEDVNKEWKGNEVKMPDGSILVADGEPGLADALAGYVEEVQRCHWHIGRDLYHAMWEDGGKAKDSRPIRAGLAGVLAVELPEGDFDKVAEADKDAVEERMENAELMVGKLIAHLEGKGYEAAADYLRRAKAGMFGYVRRWLKWGLSCPRASSMIERVMRELARRIKRIAYGWSDRGVEKIARIILKRFTNAAGWEEYWRKRMGIDGNVIINIGNYKVSSPNLGH